VQYIAYLVEVLCPASNQLPKWTGKIDPSLWPVIVGQSKIKTYRQLAEDYGVSHEAIRRTLQKYDRLSKVANL
jgi:Zn-dependent peptidase ImmA (M78 family)